MWDLFVFHQCDYIDKWLVYGSEMVDMMDENFNEH